MGVFKLKKLKSAEGVGFNLPQSKKMSCWLTGKHQVDTPLWWIVN